MVTSRRYSRSAETLPTRPDGERVVRVSLLIRVGGCMESGRSECEIGVWPAGSNGDAPSSTQFAVKICDDFDAPPINFVLDDGGDTWVAAYVGPLPTDGPKSRISEYPPVPAGATGDIAPTPIRSIGGPKSGFGAMSFQSRLTGKAKCRSSRPMGGKPGSSRLQRLQTETSRPSQV